MLGLGFKYHHAVTFRYLHSSTQSILPTAGQQAEVTRQVSDK